MRDPLKPLRVLVSEGSSTSAREAITILGLSGHHVEACDPSPWCLSRFSRFVRKFHRCPGLRDDPVGYLAFVEQRLADGKFDVLLPTHEQGVFCRGQIIGFHAYRQVAAGVGGGEAIKQSASRPVVRAYLEAIGQALDWHGALSVDYIMPEDGSTPLLIDCNPRPGRALQRVSLRCRSGRPAASDLAR
jgi:hypothetical protein